LENLLNEEEEKENLEFYAKENKLLNEEINGLKEQLAAKGKDTSEIKSLNEENLKLKIKNEEILNENEGMKSQLDEYKGKVQSISTTLDTVTNDLENIKNDIKNNKESSSNSLVRLANLLKDIQIIKNALNISTNSQPDTKEEDLNNLPSDKREFIESFENLIKDGVPFSDFIEKIDTTKYKSMKELLEFKEKNVKSVESLKKDFTAIGSSVFGNQGKESFWQKQFRIFKEKISNAIRVESSDGKIQTLGNNLNDKGLFENAQSCINNDKIEESYELINKIKSDNENITTLKSDLSNRLELNKAFTKFKTEFIKMETNKK